MNSPSLEQALTEAGSAINLLWKPNSPAPTVPVVPAEYVGWRQEQAAWRDRVALLDLCHHMADLFIEGPDATRLLSAISANNYEKWSWVARPSSCP